jgi:hypothetical protein
MQRAHFGNLASDTLDLGADFPLPGIDRPHGSGKGSQMLTIANVRFVDGFGFSTTYTISSFSSAPPEAKIVLSARAYRAVAACIHQAGMDALGDVRGAARAAGYADASRMSDGTILYERGVRRPDGSESGTPATYCAQDDPLYRRARRDAWNGLSAEIKAASQYWEAHLASRTVRPEEFDKIAGDQREIARYLGKIASTSGRIY